MVRRFRFAALHVRGQTRMNQITVRASHESNQSDLRLSQPAERHCGKPNPKHHVLHTPLDTKTQAFLRTRQPVATGTSKWFNEV